MHLFLRTISWGFSHPKPIILCSHNGIDFRSTITLAPCVGIVSEKEDNTQTITLKWRKWLLIQLPKNLYLIQHLRHLLPFSLTQLVSDLLARNGLYHEAHSNRHTGTPNVKIYVVVTVIIVNHPVSGIFINDRSLCDLMYLTVFMGLGLWVQDLKLFEGWESSGIQWLIESSMWNHRLTGLFRRRYKQENYEDVLPHHPLPKCV